MAWLNKSLTLISENQMHKSQQSKSKLSGPEKLKFNKVKDLEEHPICGSSIWDSFPNGIQLQQTSPHFKKICITWSNEWLFNIF